jgi:HEAT repeat protein
VEDETKQQASVQNGPENRLVFDFVRAMNIARRNLVAYPRGHSLVVESFEKVRAILQDFFEYSNHFTLGVAKDTLMLGTKALDKKNPVFQNFAQILFEHGIVSLTFFRNLTVDELMDFDHIISQKRNDVQHQGGVATLLSKAKVNSIKAQLIDYRMFQAEEGLVDSESDRNDAQESFFWWQFVRGVIDGTLDPQGIPLDGMEGYDPEALATLLNEHYAGGGSSSGRGSGTGVSAGEEIASYASGGGGTTGDIQGGEGPGGTGQSIPDSTSGGKDGSRFAVFLESKSFDFAQLAFDEVSTTRLNRFVRSLNHSLRKTFVERFFSSFSQNTSALNQLMPSLSDEIIVEALEKNTKKELYIPPNILDILTRLNKEKERQGSDDTNDLLGNLSREDLSDKFNTIFKEDELDRFVPLDYQKILHDVVVVDALSAPELSHIHQLEDTLSQQSMNMHLTAVVVDIITKMKDGDEVPPYLVRALKGCCMYLVSAGDFHTISDIYETIAGKMASPGNSNYEKPRGILEIFADDDFIGNVLDAPAQWGKEKDFYIVELIKRIGDPFVEPLLDRLASEENRTLRYFYLDLLAELGAMVKEPAIQRLKDNRWFLVRNLIILLRNLNDPSVLPALHGLLDHPYPRVRHELMQTLIKFNDPVAERIILQEMDSPDTGRCLKAIALAGMTRNRFVSQKLLEFLKQRGFGKTILPVKKASIHALGEIGDPAVLPALQNILKSRTFFRRHAATNLKLEILESLKKYPVGETSPILRGIAGSGPQSLTNHALSVMKSMGVGPS